MRYLCQGEAGVNGDTVKPQTEADNNQFMWRKVWVCHTASNLCVCVCWAWCHVQRDVKEEVTMEDEEWENVEDQADKLG